MTRVALCFPGQGSQAAGMADSLLDLPLARELLELAGTQGLDLEPALRADDEALRPTEIAQPALFLVESVLAAQLPVGLNVIAVAGHSVGEYAAVVAAGALSVTTGMELVIERGRLMAQMQEGAMAALLGANAQLATEVCDEVCQTREGIVVVANMNAPGQVVISGSVDGVNAAISRAQNRGVKKVVPLRVSGAFHSPLMASAAKQFALRLNDADLHNARVPVATNVDGAVTTAASELRSKLRRQLVSTVRWSECVAALVALGAEVLVEVGPGAVLTALAKRIAPEVRALSVSNLEAAANLDHALAVAIQ